MRDKRKGNRVLIRGVRRVREIGRGSWGGAGETPIVTNTDLDRGGTKLRGYGGRGGGVDWEGNMGSGVVGGASGDTKKVFVRHFVVEKAESVECWMLLEEMATLMRV